MESTQRGKLAFIIFSLIGVFNTLLDLAIYVVLYNTTHSVLIANVIASSVALIGSYFLNSRLTFKSKQWTAASFVGFIVVTVVGLWFLQTGVIYAVTPLLSHLPEHIWQLSGPFDYTLKTVTPKLLATVVTFMWNYVWYSKVIFKTRSTREQLTIALEDS